MYTTLIIFVIVIIKEIFLPDKLDTADWYADEEDRLRDERLK